MVLCRRKPRAINISSVVDCLLAIGACGIPPGARAQGLGSLEEQEELSGDLQRKIFIRTKFILKT